MINTVISKSDNGDLICNTVGLNNCIAIADSRHNSDSELESFSYEAVYPDRRQSIENVILATDKKLV